MTERRDGKKNGFAGHARPVFTIYFERYQETVYNPIGVVPGVRVLIKRAYLPWARCYTDTVTLITHVAVVPPFFPLRLPRGKLDKSRDDPVN